MGPGLGIKLQAQTEWHSPSTLVTSINHLTAKTLRAWQNFKTLKQTVKFTICVCPHKCASSILRCHKMNQPDDSDCNWVLRLSIGTPGEWQTEPAIWKKKKIPLGGVVILGSLEVRPLFSFMMLIAYRHPLTVRSQLRLDRQPGETHCPSPSLQQNHNIWCFMLKIALHSFCLTAYNCVQGSKQEAQKKRTEEFKEMLAIHKVD